MKELSFRNAGLDTLPREVFAHADTLEHLDLSGNHFTSLPDEFTRLHSLRRLFLSNNPCEELPRVIGQMPKLEMVVLKSCRLNRVAEDALPARLRWLTLTDNQLEFLPESLGHRPRLQKLALAGNRLRALPGSISNATALELIRVSANALEQFPRALLTLPGSRGSRGRATPSARGPTSPRSPSRGTRSNCTRCWALARRVSSLAPRGGTPGRRSQ